MKQKHWIKLARRATQHEFDIAYGALRFIAREYKPIAYHPCVLDWMVANNSRLVAIMNAGGK
jgi:hypothetical protein